MTLIISNRWRRRDESFTPGSGKPVRDSGVGSITDMPKAETRYLGANSILFATAHRPWPPPMTPWVMTQMWKDLLFLNYPVEPELMRSLVPECLMLDTYQHQAWVSVVPFLITRLRPPGVPAVPWISAFPELNVRTYVTYQGKPGVYFFSLDAGNLSAVWGARVFYRLPYWHADMAVEGKGSSQVEYRSKRIHGPKPAEFVGKYGPIGPVRTSVPGSLASFLTDRYCLYAWNREKLYRAEIHHLPWPLQEARAEIETNSVAKVAGIEVDESRCVMQFSRKLKVLLWAPERLL
jgi:uncharacterized protein YqjF (DUF2071 family)